MKVLTYSLVSMALVMLLIPTRSMAMFLCTPCLDNECDIEPDDCEHGVVKDFCGRKVCAKGPGQRCGGPLKILGRCGRGMHCKCERCNGCSQTTLECNFSQEVCFP